MPLPPTSLDNAYPPIWLQNYSSGKTVEGVAVADLTPITDANSLYRRINGEDKQNYWNMQREGGDLFHRDLLLEAFLKRIINYLGQRSGLLFHLPETIIAPTRHVVIGNIGNLATSAEDYTGFFVSACRVNKVTDSGDCGVRIVKADATVVYTATSYGTPADSNIFTTEELADDARGEDILVADGTGFQIQAFNEHASNNAVLSGFIMLAPKTS
jgi:hypothetical protein